MKCVQYYLKWLKTAFESRFATIQAHETDCRLVENPFIMNKFSVSGKYHLDIIELKADSNLRNSFQEKSRLEFLKFLPRTLRTSPANLLLIWLNIPLQIQIFPAEE